jgi:toxin ParE1/3/4
VPGRVMAVPRSQLLWSNDAERDLLEIWQYGAERWSPAKADDHLREIKFGCARLIGNPNLGRARDELGPGLRSILVNPHVAFYRVKVADVEIVRVIHQHEDVEIVFH